MKRYFFILFLLFASSAYSFNVLSIFDYVERDQVDKVMEILEDIKPRKEALPYFRTLSHGLIKTMEWRFRQKIDTDLARAQAITEITNSSLSDEEKEELIIIVEYISEESEETFWEKTKGLFSKKKGKEQSPPFKMEAVEIYYGALFTQVDWEPINRTGWKMIANGVTRLETKKQAEAL